MKTSAVAAALAPALLAACTSGAVGPPPAPPIDWHAFDVHRVLDAGPAGPTAKERAVVETYAAAIASSGFPQLGPSFDAGVHFAFPGMSDARGRDAVVHAHDVLFGAFDSRTIAVSRVWRTESVHALEWTMSGTHAQGWMGVATTHKPVVFKGLTLLWTKDEGSILDVHVYFDVATVKAQLGVKPDSMSAARAGRGPHPGDLEPFPPIAMPAQGTPTQVFEQAGSAEEQRNVATVRSALDALEETTDAAYLATMTEDVDVVTLERAQPMHGKDEARAYFKAMHKAIGQLDTTIDNAWAIAQFVVVEYSVSGVELGPIGWIRAQRDRVVRLHIVDVVEMQTGKIARVWRYDNPAELIETP
jgi:ketosteroid isomerase-like protein